MRNTPVAEGSAGNTFSVNVSSKSVVSEVDRHMER